MYQSSRPAAKILRKSEFYGKYMQQPTDAFSESLLSFCGSFPVRMGPVILASLVRRFTDVRFNWEKKTLQSFLELVCWISVTYTAYSLHHDAVFALQVGTFCGALMSICDEVVLQFVRGGARVIRNQPGGRDLLQRLGFDIPKNGKAPTNGEEIVLIKNLVFGYFGIVAIRALWENFHDVKFFALLTAMVGAAFVVTAEFFCLWLPTRRIGLTLQSRFTTIRQNWSEHFVRSMMELLGWTLATSYFYYSSQDFLRSLQLGTLVAVALCLCSGLEDLPEIVSSDENEMLAGQSDSYWQEHVKDDALMSVARGLVSVHNAFLKCGRAIEAEAMNMYENWGE